MVQITFRGRPANVVRIYPDPEQGKGEGRTRFLALVDVRPDRPGLMATKVVRLERLGLSAEQVNALWAELAGRLAAGASPSLGEFRPDAL